MHLICTLAITFFLLLCGGCATLFTPPAPKWTDEAISLSWPPPPKPARIKYLRSVKGVEDFVDESKSSKLYRWMTGENEKSLPFVSPYGIVADGKGRIWVADMGIKGVHVVDLSRRRIDYIFTAEDKPFESPVGLAIDIKQNRLYVSDSALLKVFVYDLKNRFQGTLSPPGNFGRPAGMAVGVDGRLYVVDVLKKLVSVFSSEGDFLYDITPPADQPFNGPTNVVVDDQENVYIADTMNFRLVVFEQRVQKFRTIGSAGDGPGYFARPRGIGVDSDGYIYVADAAFDNVQVFDSTGQLMIYFGATGKKDGDFSLPAGLYIDQEDRIYVTDTHNQRIEIFQYLQSGNTPSDPQK